MIYTSKSLGFDRRTDASVKQRLHIVEQVVSGDLHADSAKGIFLFKPAAPFTWRAHNQDAQIYLQVLSGVPLSCHFTNLTS